MQSTFSIVQPDSVAAAFDAAAAAVRSRPLALDHAGLALIAARLCCGDFEEVLDLLRSARPDAALPLALARYHAWSGDLHTALALADVVRAAIPLVEGHADVAFRRATWSALERTASDTGDAAFAAALVARARRETEADVPPAEDLDADVRCVLDVGERLLGIEPDAPRGRIRLRPELGGHAALDARDLRFADGAVSLSCRRVGGAVEYRIAQEAGAMPFTALLEPVLPAAVRASVDGRAADLDARPHPRGVIVPVQLVLDDTRTLVVETGP
jgi:hypothetical protein